MLELVDVLQTAVYREHISLRLPCRILVFSWTPWLLFLCWLLQYGTWWSHTIESCALLLKIRQLVLLDFAMTTLSYRSQLSTSHRCMVWIIARQLPNRLLLLHLPNSNIRSLPHFRPLMLTALTVSLLFFLSYSSSLCFIERFLDCILIIKEFEQLLLQLFIPTYISYFAQFVDKFASFVESSHQVMIALLQVMNVIGCLISWGYLVLLLLILNYFLSCNQPYFLISAIMCVQNWIWTSIRFSVITSSTEWLFLWTEICITYSSMI